jgi:hypothetical protein
MAALSAAVVHGRAPLVRAFNRFKLEQLLVPPVAFLVSWAKQVPQGETSMTAAIVGWAHSRFGKLEDETLESMIVKVATEAMEHAGIGPDDVDEIVLGHFNAGFSPQEFTASLVLQADDRLRFKPATRVENACATGSAAVRQGIRAIEANAARIVLVVGAEQMTKTPGAEIGKNLLKASYLPEDGDTPAGFAGVFGKIAAAYFQRHGDQSDALARIAAKNHKNGVDNPYAQMRKDFGYEFCRAESEKNPYVAGPLKRTDCSLVSDGRPRSCWPTCRRRCRCAARWPSAPTSTCRISCRCRSATSFCSRAAPPPGAARWRRRG